MLITHAGNNFIRVTNESSAISDAEYQLLPNDIPADHEPDKTVVHIFEEQANKTPDAIALVCEGVETSYRELNEQANRLAHFLQKNNIGKETCVPVCTSRTVNLIISILGILKAGAAYVPIDPEYPQKRIEYQIDDVNASVMITDKKSTSRLSFLKNISVIELDSSWNLIRNESRENLRLEINPRQLAYVIYTSGSTGKPKGVMIEHRSVYIFLSWCRQEFARSQFDVVYAATSVCFDLSVFEIFYPLCIGKRIRLLKSGLHIENYLHRDNNILLNTVPGMIDSLLKRNINLSNVTVINMAGEAVPFRLLQHLDTERIETRNLYGPTEDTTYSTVYRLRKDQPVLIGKPISQTRIYILDPWQNPVTRGAEGEIYIAGGGLARGYLNQEQLTDERFLMDPFSDDPYERMYKTGDLGKWREDGNIEFLGRIDDQVKIKGYRIELGEIEYLIEQSGLVQQAVVTGDEDRNGNKRLVAHVVPQNDFTKAAISRYLKERLPHFMIPAFFIELEKMPLTENGKIDKKRLPPAEDNLSGCSYAAPQNDTEETLATIWEDVLDMRPIGRLNGFFDLGGDSILSMQVVSRARQANLLLHPMDLFKYPTIAQLSEIIDGRSEKGNTIPTGSIVPFRRAGLHPPFFALPGFWLYRKLAFHLHDERPFFGFEPYEYSDVKEITTDFIREIKKEQPQGPYFLGGFCENYPIVFETAHQLLNRGEEVSLLVLIEAHAPYSALSVKSSRFIVRKINFYYKKMKDLSTIQKLKYVGKELKYASSLVYAKLKRKKKQSVRTYPGDVALIRSSVVAPSYSNDPKMGWQPYITGSIETITIEGDHLGILEEPSVAELADQLHSVLIKYTR